jgi:hypothetical protein
MTRSLGLPGSNGSLATKPWAPVTSALTDVGRAGGRLVSRWRAGSPGSTGGGSPARRVLTIGCSADELRELWSDPERLGRVMAEPYTADPSPWVAAVEESSPEAVRFVARSRQGAPLSARGAVTFRPAPQDLGTEVTLELRLDAPAVAAGAAAHKALRRAKSLAETGEIPTTADNPSARHEPQEA